MNYRPSQHRWEVVIGPGGYLSIRRPGRRPGAHTDRWVPILRVNHAPTPALIDHAYRWAIRTYAR